MKTADMRTDKRKIFDKKDHCPVKRTKATFAQPSDRIDQACELQAQAARSKSSIHTNKKNGTKAKLKIKTRNQSTSLKSVDTLN